MPRVIIQEVLIKKRISNIYANSDWPATNYFIPTISAWIIIVNLRFIIFIHAALIYRAQSLSLKRDVRVIY